MLKMANQIVVFAIEIAMLCSFAYFGFQQGNTIAGKFALAISIPAVSILIWSFWAAPKSRYRLKMPYLAIFRLFLFLLASTALYKCDKAKYAVILAIFSAVTQVVSLLTEKAD
jgi:hypothetical protein